MNKIITEDGTNNLNEFPSISPLCKSPNSNKLSICEWCGNQII